MSDTHFIVVGGKPSTHALARRIVEECLPADGATKASYGLVTEGGYEFQAKRHETFDSLRTGLLNHISQFMADAGLSKEIDRLNLFFLDNPYGENDFDQSQYKALLEIRNDEKDGFCNLSVWHIVLGYDTEKPADVTRQTDDNALSLAIRPSEGSADCTTLYVGPRNITGGANFESKEHHDFALPRALADFMVLASCPKTLGTVGNAASSSVFSLGYSECMYHAADVIRLQDLYLQLALVRFRLYGTRPQGEEGSTDFDKFPTGLMLALELVRRAFQAAKEAFVNLAKKYEDWDGNNAPADFLNFLDAKIEEIKFELNDVNNRRDEKQRELDGKFISIFCSGLKEEIAALESKARNLLSLIDGIKRDKAAAQQKIADLKVKQDRLDNTEERVGDLLSQEANLIGQINAFSLTTFRDTFSIIDEAKLRSHFDQCAKCEDKGGYHSFGAYGKEISERYEKSIRKGESTLRAIFEDFRKEEHARYAKVNWSNPFDFISVPDLGKQYAKMASYSLPRVSVSKEKADLFKARQIFVFANVQEHAEDNLPEMGDAYQAAVFEGLCDKICMLQLTAVDKDSISLLTGENTQQADPDAEEVRELPEGMRRLPGGAEDPDIVDAEVVDEADDHAEPEEAKTEPSEGENKPKEQDPEPSSDKSTSDTLKDVAKGIGGILGTLFGGLSDSK